MPLIRSTHFTCVSQTILKKFDSVKHSDWNQSKRCMLDENCMAYVRVDVEFLAVEKAALKGLCLIIRTV